MNNLIINAFAYDYDMRSGENFAEKDSKKNYRVEVYLKNSIVSLVSAKLNNPHCDVCLCVNNEVPVWVEEKLEKYNINMKIIPFDGYRVDKTTRWGLCYYKFCVLSHMIQETDYDNYCLIDVDTYVAYSLDDLWDELSDRVMVYNNYEKLSNSMRARFIHEYGELYGKCDKTLPHLSSAGIIGKKNSLKTFLDLSEEIYNYMQMKNFQSRCGDEFILFCCNAQNPNMFCGANAYFENLYTIEGYYVITTKYAFEKIPIWHMLFEKENGMLRVYEYIDKHQRLPQGRYMWKLIGLPQPDKNFGTLRWLIKRMQSRVLKLLKG